MRRYFTMLPAWLATLFLITAPAHGAIRVLEDHGGNIGDYLDKYALIEAAGGKVIVDGDCISACTLALGTLSPASLCVTPRARFGFHSAWSPDAKGNPVFSKEGTARVWQTYPPKLRAIITAHGWNGKTAHPDLLWIEGSELGSVVRSCTPQDAHAS